MVSRAATFLVLSFGVTTAGAWGTVEASRCTDECLAHIDPGAGAETCYSVTQGKPVKSCLSSFRDAIKKSCNKVCAEGDVSQLVNEANIYCDYARHELPRPTVHRACIMGYSNAFDKVTAFFTDNPEVLEGGFVNKAEPVESGSEEEEEEHDEHLETLSDDSADEHSEEEDDDHHEEVMMAMEDEETHSEEESEDEDHHEDEHDEHLMDEHDEEDLSEDEGEMFSDEEDGVESE